MPRVRTQADPLRRVLLGNELSGEELAHRLGVSVTTAYRRLADPTEMTVAELRRLVGRVPIDELRGAI